MFDRLLGELDPLARSNPAKHDDWITIRLENMTGLTVEDAIVTVCVGRPGSKWCVPEHHCSCSDYDLFIVIET